MIQTPMLNRLNKIEEEAKYVGNFLDWLLDVKKYKIAIQSVCKDQSLRAPGKPVAMSIPYLRECDEDEIKSLMEEYFGVNMEEAKAEASACIEEMMETAMTKQEEINKILDGIPGVEMIPKC